MNYKDMYAIKDIIKDFNIGYTSENFAVKLKHHIKSKLYKIDKVNFNMLKCTTHCEMVNESSKFKITILPHNLYSLVYFSTGEKPDLNLLKGKHDDMNDEPIKYGQWILYFKKDYPISINKNLGTSVNTIDKFNL